MTKATYDSITTSTSSFYFRQLAAKAATSTYSVEHIAFLRALVVTWCVVIQLYESFQDTDTLVFPAVEQESVF